MAKTTRLSLALTVLLLNGALAVAADPVTIEKLHANAESYHFKVVTLQGTAHQIQIIVESPGTHPQLDFRCAFVHPAYTFVLADETGFQQITVPARLPCVSKHSPAEPPDVEEGDLVTVDVQIAVAADPSGGVRRRVAEALVRTIHRLGK